MSAGYDINFTPEFFRHVDRSPKAFVEAYRSHQLFKRLVEKLRRRGLHQLADLIERSKLAGKAVEVDGQ